MNVSLFFDPTLSPSGPIGPRVPSRPFRPYNIINNVIVYFLWSNITRNMFKYNVYEFQWNDVVTSSRVQLNDPDVSVSKNFTLIA